MKKNRILCCITSVLITFNMFVSTQFTTTAEASCITNQSTTTAGANYLINQERSEESTLDAEVSFSPFDNQVEKVLKVLDEAQDEVVIAHYNARLTPILSKLVDLSKKGVKIKVVVDKDNALKEWNVGDDYLEENGIEVIRSKPEKTIGTTNYSIMHLKSVVIDKKTVMTGSLNWNATAAYCNDENMVVIRNEQVAKIYRNQILQLFEKKPSEIEKDQDSDIASIHFSPEQGLSGFIQKQIDKANESIEVSMFTFTEKYISKSLLNAAKRGVKVKVIMEKKQCDFSKVDEALENQPNVELHRVGNTLSQFSAMHQKYCVIDDKTVITGSANWTASGTKFNDEDILILSNRDIAKKYHQNFLDLIHVYEGISSTFEDEEIREKAPVLFHANCSSTQPGDKVVVVGNVPELGDWNVENGLVMSTSDDLFPDWFVKADIDPGVSIEYKYVILRENGDAEWEDGLNRNLNIPDTARASEISGTYGNTADNWTPAQNNKTTNNNHQED
ncbi:phospholipase D-like domain-containing protein [Clostridium sp. M14]|uniref:phospholipase D-like domain-containing protein n=1 Tax=Clostridium sp. M14 TaxID=2716311 RepID=UPI0013EEB787|nr:phospholipase D-like domain-containing protein [Clostridium sp. M14]MBZ9691920.1 phospholipase D-like domain-containing protein [Clostridium sp. M14]